ncbi:MAG TPA: Holliday junction resolvase RuvX [Candidatus Hydrogenedentes bacterium]|jgi:putative Holliday junction resolvase|nr:Holliday junction resolvase RuvX [Candidatus Hydrogenedentota bacterium]HPK00440.1 Holliday junction resolvase RuvX [Candidatus Hydrogenedentota bacterium]
MPEEGRIIGLDIGDVRIGIAVSDPLGITAQGREVLSARSPEEDAAAICALAKEVEAIRVVVGLPLDQNGEIGPQAAKVLAFVETLRELLDIDIVTQDERFSTAAAQRALIDANMRRKKRKSVIDMVAAQHILQTYLDRQRRPGI